jgi:hypothetical protein
MDESLEDQVARACLVVFRSLLLRPIYPYGDRDFTGGVRRRSDNGVNIVIGMCLLSIRTVDGNIS